MGCTPSHNGIIQIIAKNAAKPLKKNKAILPPNQDSNGIIIPLSGDKSPSCYDSNEESKQKDKLQEIQHQTGNLEKGPTDVLGELSRSGSVSDEQGKYEKHETADEGMVNLTYQKRRHVRKYSSTGSEQELPISVQQEGNPRRSRKSKSQKSRLGRRAKPNQIVFHEVEKKVDFPEQLVKAHQDAYAFLNPNLSKYEAVISMANQAAETQVIMQQMISFMVLRFDDINQCLGEIAEDGEQLLKGVGSNLTWPFRKGDPTEQPDLLQQLLQYTVNKMQSVNCTISTLTTNALQETCSFLQSAVNTFQEKLKQKEHYDERLMKMIKLLEDSAAVSPQPHPNDLPLNSEDSGIGGDSESIRGYRSPDKMGRQESIDSSGQVSLERSEGITPMQLSINKNKMSEPTVNFKSMPDQKESVNHSSQAQLSNPRVSKQTSLASSLSASSLASTATLEQDSTYDQESEETTSSDESYDESEDNKSITSQITLPQRPLTSPAGTSAYRHPSKWLENPENEEMTLKMKEAISEKIKFVPGKSRSNVWTREEDVNSEVVRPSTADGSNRRSSKHRRSRSAESLRSQAEDPTLLQLQRTQKELNKKLEQLYSSNGTKNKETPQNINVKSFSHTSTINLSNITSTNKLKACLDKSFNILPSQERVTMRKLDKDTAKDSSGKQNSKTLGTTLHSQAAKTEDNPTLVQRKLESLGVSPRQSVRKLIQTFSPVDDSIKTPSVKTLGPLRCVRKFGVPVLPPTIPAYKGLQPLDNKSHIVTGDENPKITSTYLSTSTFIAPFPSSITQDDIRTDTTESGTEDYENLPPPPLEILMDDSFNLLQTNEHEKDTNLTCPMKKTSMPQKIKASINIKHVLPSKNVTDRYMSADKTVRKKETVIGLRKYSLEPGQQNKDKELGLEIQRKHEIEQAAHLYKQSHKIIHLQNPGDGEVVRLSSDGDTAEACTPAPILKPKQCSPTLKRNEKIPVTLRRTSPTRTTASSPPTERKLTSPPANRVINKTSSHVPRPPPEQKNTSPTSTTKEPSPPTQKKLPSPPSQRKLSSPPQIRRQQSPPNQGRLPSPPQIRSQQSPPIQRRLPSPPQIQSPPSQRKLPSPPQIRSQQSPPNQRRLPSPPQLRSQKSPPSQRRLPSPPQIRSQQSPPSQRRLPSPPSNHHEPSPPSQFTPSPPISPSFTHKGIKRSSDDQQLSSKMIGNAQSIFCPSSTSLFEAKPPSPPCTSILESASNQASSPVLRHSFSSCQYGDQHRRVAMSAANPQPFVRRCYSDRRPRVQLRLPTSISASAVSEPALQQIGVEEPARKDSEPGTGQSLTDPRAAGQTASHPGLCVVGQGLQ